MRRATNNKRGRWMEVALKTSDNKKVVAGTFYAYKMKSGDSKYYVVFTKKGELFETQDKVFVAVPIEPPKWASNMWDVSDEAEKVNHYALLYDARYKTIISDCYEASVKRDVKDYIRIVNFLNELLSKEPWQ